ncbi:MAG: transcriptional activator protein [Gemmatimonadetes bacterium]|nr:transcriptional activator protein [Gemmatimonadota bacterium]
MQPGTSIGPFQIVAPLGAGGMGEVFRAHDTRLEREVALKLLPSSSVADERAVERFAREARAASALNHPNIVTIYDIGESAFGRYIAMELIKGRTLATLIKAGGAEATAVDVIAQAAEALAVAHEAGIVHRDIKPENVMVRDDGYVKVLDFGLARLLNPGAPDGAATREGTNITEAGMVLGTVRYLSPEQGCGELVGSPTDVFALGVVLYELLTGVHPFAASSTMGMLGAILSRPAAAPSTHRAGLSPALDTLVLHMLSKESAPRPTAREVSDTLRAYAGIGNRAGGRTGGSDHATAPAGGDTDRSRIAAARPPDRPWIVGRERDRERMLIAYANAVLGTGSVLSLSGEPGIGKTTLVEDCLVRMTDSYPCSLARGRCSERLAGTEAYLPILEALDGVLHHDRDGAVREVMARVAPTWYANVRTESAARVVEESTDLRAVSQEKMKREIAVLLTEASRVMPVVLFIDDLHWADASTIDLLAYLGPRITELRVLIVLTYRPSEMRLAKHPFLSVQLDLQARGIASEIALDFLSRENVVEFLALQYPDNHFPADFARAIHDKTEGNPLFMVDVVRYLGSLGVIAQTDGSWGLARSVPDIVRELPQSVRSMIERKIEQLGESDRRLLSVASVQGYEFDSAVVAAVLGLDAADVEDQLVTLERVYVFVHRVEEIELPDRTLTVRYRFVHVLYQNALHGALTASRRVSYSAKVAAELERHYGARAGDVASEIAVLCETAREPGRAAQYYTLAAERASQVFAYDEAEALGHRGLAQVALLPEGPERIGLELGLSLSLGFTNLTRKGFAHPETAEHMNRARQICHMLGEIPPLAPVLFGLCLFHIASDRVQEGYDDAERLLRLAEGTGEAAHRMIAHCAATGSLAHLGRPEESLDHFRRATEFFDPARRMTDRERFHSDPYLMAACEAVRDLWPMGRFDEARRMSERTIELARITLDPRDRAFAGLFAAELQLEIGNFAEAERIAAEAIALCEEYGIASERLWNLSYHGAALRHLGQAERGLAEIEGALNVLLAIRGLVTVPEFCGYRAESLAALGRFDEALSAVDQGLAIAADTSEHLWDANILRIRGDLLLMRVAEGASTESDIDTSVALAERAYLDAIDDARTRGTLTFELRAALGLARLREAQGRADEGRDMVADVYEKFPPANGVDDLNAARELLGRSEGSVTQSS